MRTDGDPNMMKLVTKKSKNKPTWTDLKKKLAGLDRAGLLGLIQDLYAADKTNKIFLHTRFGLGGEQLQPYKTIISRWVHPNVIRDQSFSVVKAEKAVSDYKKAIGRPEGLAELAMFYCEECASFIDNCGMDSYVYFNALVRVFDQALMAMNNVSKELQDSFVERMDRVYDRINDYDELVGEDLYALICDYGFNEEE